MEEGAKSTATESPALITVNVQFSGQKFPISISPDSTIKELKSHLQPLTNVLPRGQKLICKGKVLTDAMSLKSLQIVNGSKLMLVATQGLHQGVISIPFYLMFLTKKSGTWDAMTRVQSSQIRVFVMEYDPIH